MNSSHSNNTQALQQVDSPRAKSHECPICYEIWDDITHRPFILACSHNFCESCIAKLKSDSTIKVGELIFSKLQYRDHRLMNALYVRHNILSVTSP